MEMKRLSQKILLALTMMCSLWLTSCDEDISLSMTLSGKWKGDWGMYYVYEYRGHEMIFNCYDTHIEFFPDYDMAPMPTSITISTGQCATVSSTFPIQATGN